jgi:small subunit ribosomal protein S18
MKKKNLLKGLGLSAVDYKDTRTLRVFISERGRGDRERGRGDRERGAAGRSGSPPSDRPGRSGSPPFKDAREMALLPYPATTLR